MGTKKKKEILLGGLMVILLGLVGFQFKGAILGSGTDGEAEAAPAQVTPLADATEEIHQRYMQFLNRVEDEMAHSEPKVTSKPVASIKRDPFSRPGATQRKLVDKDRRPKRTSPKPRPRPGKSVVLNGIMWNAERPSAVINNQVVYEGSRVDGILVKRIRPQDVTVVANRQTVVLTPGSQRFVKN